MSIMVFDRTAGDVAYAKKIRADKIRKGIAINDDEKAILEKGFLTLTTIRRIEEKQYEIKLLLNEMGYYSTPTENKEWSPDEFFKMDDLERIVKNNTYLKNAFYVLSTTPTNARARYNYSDINKIEELLNDLDIVINDAKKRYKRCGTFNSGEQI